MSNYGLTEAEKSYHLHEYNHPLFNNMKAFMDSCWEINLTTGTAVVLYEANHPEYEGVQFEYDDILRKYGESSIYPLEREEWYYTFSAETLSKLTEETPIDLHIVGKTGIPEICRFILTPARDPEGNPQRVYLSAKNIESDIKMLREMQEQKQIIFAAMNITYPIIIYTNLTQNTYTVYMNTEQKLDIPMTGSYDALVRRVTSSVLPKYRRNFRAQHSRSMLERNLREGGQYIVVEYEQEIDGVTHWLSSKTVRINNPVNSDFMAITLTAIIDEQRKSEYIAKIAMQDAYHAAIDSGKAKSEFLSRMSHEMLTPLNTIQCLVSLGIENIGNEKQLRRIFSEIGKASSRLDTHISRLLETSMLESESITLSEAPAELSQELMHAVGQMIDAAAGKNISFDVSCDEITHNSVICDPLRLKQIFSALIGNAFKFTGSGGSVSITLKEGKTRRSGFGYYKFTVKDTGIGIEEEYFGRIFEPFERLDDSRADRNVSSGLGLYITKHITKLLGGNITVKSKLNEGSEFTATFFLKIRDVQKPPEEGSGAPDEKISFEGKRILVVEDNELNNEIICDLLRDMDFTVESAGDGKEATDKILASAPGYYNAVLMDLMMPVMDGYKTARTIRGSGREDLKTIPIIAASANSYPEDIEESLRCGMNDHIAKPLDADFLARVLRRWILNK